MRLFSLLLFLIALPACNNNPDRPQVEQLPAKDTLRQEAVTDKLVMEANDSVPFNIQIDTVIHFDFGGDTLSKEIIVKGTLNKRSDPVVCYLPVQKKTKLKAQIIPDDSNLNIRFSQLVLPDKTTDGPFGRQLNYKLEQSGMYKFIIAPNSMADGKRSGDFQVRLELKDY